MRHASNPQLRSADGASAEPTLIVESKRRRDDEPTLKDELIDAEASPNEACPDEPSAA